MDPKKQYHRIVFGLKINNLRKKNSLSFLELSKKSGLSVSYLNEIEKGKKFPKRDKIEQLAKAFDEDYDSLLSSDLDKKLAPLNQLLRSNFLQEVPWEVFGIDLLKVVEIIASSPDKVGAFIQTILDIARKYDLKEERFYFSALRSYLEMNNNYFQDLENEATAFLKKNKSKGAFNLSLEEFEYILTKKYHYKINRTALKGNENLEGIRAYYSNNKQTLFLNPGLSRSQRKFALGRELARNILKLDEDSILKPTHAASSFDQVLNNYRASYFSVALQLPIDTFKEDLTLFFSKDHFDPKFLLGFLQKYKITAETLFSRMSNLIPKFFGMEDLFFLRFTKRTGESTVRLNKELHLNMQHQPHANDLNEHYCKRWLSLSIFDLEKEENRSKGPEVIAIQKSVFTGTDHSYLCFTIRRPGFPNPEEKISLSIGVLLNEKAKKWIQFWNDPAIPEKLVNQTCERCEMANCLERVVPPKIILEKQRKESIHNGLLDLEQ